MKVRVRQIFSQDSFTYNNGPMAGTSAFGWLVIVDVLEGQMPLDPQTAQPYAGLKLNTKAPNVLVPGDEFDAGLTGKEGWGTRGPNGESLVFAPVKMTQGSMVKAPGVPRTSAIDAAPAANAPQQAPAPSRPRSTVGDRLKLLHSLIPRAQAMVASACPTWTPDAQAHATVSVTMNLAISLERGELAPDPTPAEIEAAAAAKAAAEAQAAAVAAVAQMPPAAPADDEIPF